MRRRTPSGFKYKRIVHEPNNYVGDSPAGPGLSMPARANIFIAAVHAFRRGDMEYIHLAQYIAQFMRGLGAQVRAKRDHEEARIVRLPDKVEIWFEGYARGWFPRLKDRRSREQYQILEVTIPPDSRAQEFIAELCRRQGGEVLIPVPSPPKTDPSSDD